MTQPNPSTAQARVIVDELWRHGVDYAVVSPGSRSGAIAIALAEHPGMQTAVVADERSAAFRALGRARATGTPSIVVATSGTALANHFPAVVEADLSLVPLISISADRPPELLHVGANQTIDQRGIFAGRVRWSVDIPPADPGRDQEGYWRSTISQAVARAFGHGARPGPVHLDIAFREPTVPVGDDGRSSAEPYGFQIHGRPDGEPWQVTERPRPGAGEVRLPEGHGLVVAGEGDYDAEALMMAAAGLHWPLLATATSGARGDGAISSYHHLLVEAVPETLRPDFVVTVGRIGPSDRLAHLTELPGTQVQIEPWGVWHDPRRHSTHMVQADPAATLATLRPAPDDRLVAAWKAADSAMRSALDDSLGTDRSTGPAVGRALGNVDLDWLVVGSSLPIRDVDAHYTGAARVISNRGASGIDGVVSTSLGAVSVGGRLLAYTGDLSFLHDVSGLVGDGIGDLVLVVVDNGGGGLFDLLPQARFAPEYERLFVAPHHLDLVRIGAALGLEATRVETITDLHREAQSRQEAGGAHLIVVPVDRDEDVKMRRSLDEIAAAVCDGLR